MMCVQNVLRNLTLNEFCKSVYHCGSYEVVLRKLFFLSHSVEWLFYAVCLLLIIQHVVHVFISLVSIRTLVQNVFGYWPGTYSYLLS